MITHVTIGVLNLSLTEKILQLFGTNPLWNLHLSGFLIHAFQTHVVGHCSQCRKMSIGSGCFSDFMAKRNSHTRHGYAIRQLQTELNTNKSQDIHSKSVALWPCSGRHVYTATGCPVLRQLPASFCHCLQLDTAVIEPPHHCGGSSLASLVPLVGSTSGPDRGRDGSRRVHWCSEQMANEPMFSKWFYKSMAQQTKKINEPSNRSNSLFNCSFAL